MFCSKSPGNVCKGAEHGAEGDAGTFRTPINRHHARPLALRYASPNQGRQSARNASSALWHPYG